jgi:cytochrome c oxidase assembly protein subunit 15
MTDTGSSRVTFASANARISRVLAAGFGATTLMWLFSYLAILVQNAVVGDVLFGLAVLSLLLGGVVAGRTDVGLGESRPARGKVIIVFFSVRGMLVGLVSAVLNLLIVASLLKSELAGGSGWIIGILVGCVVVGGVGGAIGWALPSWRTNGNWLTIFCWVVVGLTFFMIVTGGIVTGFEAGLAVPDWPNSYGHNMLLYPLSEMVANPGSGVFYEHAHRLTGMFVGLAALTLCTMLWIGDGRMWIGFLGITVLILVIVQGVLGGLRVTGNLTMSQEAADLSPSTVLAVAHGVLAQVLLAIMSLAAAATSSRWRRGDLPMGEGRLSVDRQLAIALVVFLLIQLVLGAAYRHMITEFGPKASGASHALMGHIAMAVVVAIAGVFVGLRGCSMNGRDPVFKWLGWILLVAIGLQILLGFGGLAAVMMRTEIGTTADVPVWEVLVTSAHQANGALMLMVSVLMLSCYWRASPTQDVAIGQ